MFPFWQNVTRPLIQAIQPNVLVEVGSEQGKTTDLALDYCVKNDAVLHVIDPAPRYDIQEYARRFGRHFVFHKDLSLNALPRIPDAYQVVLLDGDHNWYTVYNELRAIEVHCHHLQIPFPLVVMHDVAWPYGRRDLYYNPQTIPEEHRQPFARKGVWPGRPLVLEIGGLNHSFYHALQENTPRNGVRTAVEDFLNDSQLDLDFLVLPGFFGLGILARKELRQPGSPVAALLDMWDLPEAVSKYIQQLENVRIQLTLQQIQAQQAAFATRVATQAPAESAPSA